MIPCDYPSDVCEFVDYVREILEPDFCIGVVKGHDIVGHHQHLFNFPWADDMMSHSVYEVQSPRAEHIVREYEVFLR